MNTSIRPLLALLPPALIVMCAPAGRRVEPDTHVRHEYAEVHMGMPVRIVLHAADDSSARSAARAAFRRIAALEDIFSDYRAHSEVRRLESLAGAHTPVSEPLFAVLRIAIDIARLSDGAFDPTVAPLVQLWRDARRTGVPPTRAALDSAMRHGNWRDVELDTAARTVRLQPGMRLDLGAVAKGWILDAALAALREHGAPAALVEAGGDIVTGDPPPGRAGWSIAVPAVDADFARQAAALSRAALATSGPGSQYLLLDGVRHSHVIDPRTGLAVTRPWTAHVIAADAATADALATALSVLGPEGLPLVKARFPHSRAALTAADGAGASGGSPLAGASYQRVRRGPPTPPRARM